MLTTDQQTAINALYRASYPQKQDYVNKDTFLATCAALDAHKRRQAQRAAVLAWIGSPWRWLAVLFLFLVGWGVKEWIVK